jgi:hypothetical protein
MRYTEQEIKKRFEYRRSGVEAQWRLAPAGRSQTLPQALQAFMQRRHDRCRMVVNNSLRIGELEVEGASPEAQTDLVNTSLRLLAEPI